MHAAPSWLRTQLRGMPPVLAAVLIGAVLLGACGGVVGLVVGLRAYPPTAWFAVFEVGVPAAVVGALLGLVASVIARMLGGPPTSDVEPE